jgi:hypothetical protein
MEQEMEMGPQPIGKIMEEKGLSPHDLVAASVAAGRPMTHKMVSRAVRGRRLTRNTKSIVQNALNLATGETYALNDLFNYV